MLIGVGEGQAEAILRIARDDVDVEVRHVLERDLAICDEEVHAACAKRLSCKLRQLTRDLERAHGDGFVEVVHQHGVLTRHHKHVAVRDRLDIHERDHGVVLVGEARGRLAANDGAENAVGAHSQREA